MDKIKRFIECMIPSYSCNLICEYCYVIQGQYRDKAPFKLNYNLEIIRKATTKERFGGICFFSLCAAGETLIPKETIEIAKILLENGHYVNITNNGTITNRINELINLPKEFKNRLHLSFSFHYLELKKLNLLNIFFNNVIRSKEAGISIFVQIGLCDNYIPYIDEIKILCMDKLGAYPQCHVLRRNEFVDYSLFSELTYDEYNKIGKSFNSSLFEFTLKNFMQKQKDFCYAGDWSLTLNFGTGNLSKCYGKPIQNIFKNNNKIKFEAIGNNCYSPYCVNSSHFLSLGCIPSLKTPSYVELRNRKEAMWYSENMEKFLDSKLEDNNKKYHVLKKIIINLKNRMKHSIYLIIKKVIPIKKIKKKKT